MLILLFSIVYIEFLILQYLFKLVSRPHVLGPASRIGNVQYLADLFVVITLDQVQAQHNPVAVRQCLYGIPDPVYIDFLPAAILIFQTTCPLIDFLETDMLFLQIVQRTVNHYSLQPCAKTDLSLVGVNLSEGVEKSLLHGIFSIGRIPHDPEANIVHAFIKKFVQFKLCLAVAVPASVNQFLMDILITRFQWF